MILKVQVKNGLVVSVQPPSLLSKELEARAMRDIPNMDVFFANHLIIDGWEVVAIFPVEGQDHDKEMWFTKKD